MSYWEFLIQRENDRAWRPLTSRSLQVFEGNYRIIANTSIFNSTVRTQVFYQTDKQPPQLSQNRSQTISNEGMLVVLPFTYLRTGIWHLNCNVTVSADREVHEQLRLKVIPRDIPNTTDHPDPENSAPSNSPPATPDINIAATDLDSNELIAAAVSDLDMLLADLDMPSPPIPVPLTGNLPFSEAATIDRPLQLDCEIFHAADLTAIMVTGVVNLEMLSGTASKLVATLRNPQDGTMLTKVEQVLPPRQQQFAFQLPLDLPAVSNHFLMGETSLQTAQSESLVTSSFTITYDQVPNKSAANPEPTVPPPDLSDPFAAALQIAIKQQEKQNSVNPAVTAAQLQEIIAASDLEIAKLDTGNIPLHSYDPDSYEVVVED